MIKTKPHIKKIVSANGLWMATFGHKKLVFYLPSGCDVKEAYRLLMISMESVE